MKNATMFARYVGGILLVAFALSSAQATTISFTEAAEGGVYTNPTGSGNGPSLYTAAGFQFLATGSDGHFHVNSAPASSVLMHSNFGNTTSNTWILSKVGNGLFDVSGFGIETGSLVWTTNLGTTGSTLVGANNVGLKGINSLTFRLAANNGSATITDFTVNASVVPEPETTALFLAGLGMLGFVARRRKQAAAA